MTSKEVIEMLLNMHGYKLTKYEATMAKGGYTYKIESVDSQGDQIKLHDEFDMVVFGIINQTKDIFPSILQMEELKTLNKSTNER